MQDLEKQLEAGTHQHGAAHSPDAASQTPDPVSSSPQDTSTGSEKLTPANGAYSPTRPSLSHNRSQTGVSVERAEADFAELNRQLSRVSQSSRKLSKTASRGIGARLEQDVEKTATSSEESEEGERFDLETTLRGAREEEQAYGIKAKRIGVVWEGLTVKGLGGVRNFVKTFPDAFVDFFNIPGMVLGWFGIGKKGEEFDILKDFKGLVRPGEMVLVLGKPSSGCTTFLKVIANQRFGYTRIDGEVLYGPFDAKTFANKYRGEAVYNQEDDIHHPTLTVGQTLGFALDTKTPGKRPGGISKKEFKARVVDLLLKMFNIEHTLNTVVGNPFMRGVSGGERKRVSIAEMMITSATVCAWDNTTRGLDASTALDYAKSLRIMTNIYQTTTFVSLYQASENIYSQFDKVMVIDAGRQVFFGPAKEARGYFESLGFKEKPRQTTPDYLTGCTDPFEREYKEGAESTAPHGTEDLAAAFLKSPFAERLSEEMTVYRKEVETEKETFREFEIAHQDSKRKHTPKSSVYSAPFYIQIWSLMKRQFLIKWQDKFSLIVSWITSTVIAIILGTVWLNTPTTSAGAFTRGGLLFLALLFNSFQAFGELAGMSKVRSESSFEKRLIIGNR